MIFNNFQKKIKNKLNYFLETKFNKNIIYGKSYRPLKIKKYPKDNNYWNAISLEIERAASSKNEKYFFYNWLVMLHLAGVDYSLGYKFLNKIKNHVLGEELLNKCQTPPWGSPFLLKKFPFLSPTTASHLANIISIHDAFGDKFKNFKNVVDFGGGYGGLARCLCEISKNTHINIVDIQRMLKIQKKYIVKTSNFEKRISFLNNVNLLKGKYCLFNASFSFSEVPLVHRKNIENFIINKCNRLHIIYQDNFNNMDNIKLMNEFALRLKSKKWKIFFKPYGYGSNSKFIMYGIRISVQK